MSSGTHSRPFQRLRNRAPQTTVWTSRHESWLDTGRLQDPDELGARLDEDRVSVLVVEPDFVFEESFEAAGSLRLVGVCRTSVSHVDVAAATRHGVAVVNAPGRNSQAVAEHALGLMLSLARGIPSADAYVRGGRWENPVEPYVSMRGGELSGRKLGVVGLGRIGRTLAGIGTALGMEVAAHDPYVDADQGGVPLKGLDDLLAWADFVSMHLPGERRDGRTPGPPPPVVHAAHLISDQYVRRGRRGP